jgi:carotenoid cleavage dioxygenase
MTRRLTRRDALKWGGFGAAALLHPAALGGCSSDSGGGPSASTGGSGGADGGELGGAFEPPTFDPAEPWWLQYDYAPVDEREAMELTVEGAIPPELDGLYVRNGSNPLSGTSAHWFVGDGMLHGVRIQDGKALWYRNRYVQTEPLKAGGGYENVAIPEGGANASNVSVIEHAGHLLTLGEVGFPYEVDRELGTVGVYDFGGLLEGNFTAHPKLDAVTGEMLAFGYDFSPTVRYHRIDPSGALVNTEVIELQGSAVMMHDFQITATHVVFMDLPIIFDLDMVSQGSSFPFRWDGSNGARFGVMPREGTAADVKWFDVDSCYIFHTMNAFDHPTRSDVIVLIAARHPPGLWATGPNDFDSQPMLTRYEIDLTAGTVTETRLDDRMTEFVQLDRRLVGRQNRYGYGVWLGDSDGMRPGRFRGLLKFDLDFGTVTENELPAALEAAEPYFVPAGDGAGEDEGYLMTYVYDWARDKTDLYLFDASNLAAEPVAKVKLPYRVPFGFHGVWVPA